VPHKSVDRFSEKSRHIAGSRPNGGRSGTEVRFGRDFPKLPHPLTTYSPNRINTLTLQPILRLL